MSRVDEEEEQASDSCAGLTEDVDSPESVGMTSFSGSQIPTVTNAEYAEDYSSFIDVGEGCGQEGNNYFVGAGMGQQAMSAQYQVQ